LPAALATIESMNTYIDLELLIKERTREYMTEAARQALAADARAYQSRTARRPKGRASNQLWVALVRLLPMVNSVSESRI
jgi:hypothetical protein